VKRHSLVVSGVVCSLISLSVPVWGQADAQRGAEVLKRERCVECHSVGGQKGGTAPDLGRRQAQAYNPARLASVMWNHAPQMWTALEAKKISIPKLTEQDSEDVFAYLYSLMFFDQPGDVSRGAAAFQDKGCVICHALQSPGENPVTKGPKPAANRPPANKTASGPGLPVALWNSVADPVLLVQQMWNHAASMKEAQASMHLGWLRVTGQDLVDISAYLNSLPVIHAGPGQFSLPQPASGAPLFATRGRWRWRRGCRI